MPEGEYRERCYGCYRPVASCFCDAIPHVKNSIDVLVLQHQRERRHPFNTARIVNKALARCELIFDSNESFANRKLPIKDRAALLYPSSDARLVSDLAPQEMPSQLIVIDGTWDHAKALFRDIPQLHDLPRLKLNPSTPGQYRIRREPTATALSTVEATVQALKQMEPQTDGLDRLIEAFDTMVRQQLAHPSANYDQPEIDRSGTINVPRALLRDPSKIVVAYGEATPTTCGPSIGWDEFNRRKKQAAKAPPVFWIAQRLDAGPAKECCFAEFVRPENKVSESGLAHMGLAESDFESAISCDEFRQRWSEFLNKDDLLVVPNEPTIRLLQNSGVSLPRCISLKAINHDPHGNQRRLTEFLESVAAPAVQPCHESRAGKRLANAIALTHFLRSLEADSL